MKMLKNYIISGEIEVLTGLHIGGLKETLEIGGTDDPVIRTYYSIDGKNVRILPYIPGSSLKGKIRALLEYEDPYVDIKRSKADGYIKIGDNFIKYPANSPIPKIFGVPAEEGKEGSISRAVFRDSHPTSKTIEWWDSYIELINGAEVKAENTINRLTSSANPRQFERVPPGSKFELKIILTIYENDNAKEFLETILKGMKLITDNYLGGSGSRGYGRIKFNNIKIIERSREYYTEKEEEKLIYEEKDDEFNIRTILSKLE